MVQAEANALEQESAYFCDFCKTEEDPSISVQVAGSKFDFCDWPCVGAFALTKGKEVADKNSAAIADLERKVKELDYVLLQVRGQVGI